MLLSTISVEDKAKRGWEKALMVELSSVYWQQLKWFNLSGNVAIQENRFKVLARWYLTPIKLAKMYPPDDC